MAESSYELQCSTQRDKSFWISVYASLGSSYLLFSILVFLLYFTVYRNQEEKESKLPKISHLTFGTSLLVKSFGYCASGIVLRINHFKWEIVSQLFLNVPQSLLVVSSSLFIMRWCLSEARHLNQPLGNKVAKVLSLIPIASMIFFGAVFVLSVIVTISKSDFMSQTNIWACFARDLLTSIPLLVCIHLIKSKTNIGLDSAPSIKTLSLLSMVILIAFILRGICYPVSYYTFAKPIGSTTVSKCKVPSLVFFITEALAFEVFPTFLILALEGNIEKAFSYHPVA